LPNLLSRVLGEYAELEFLFYFDILRKTFFIIVPFVVGYDKGWDFSLRFLIIGIIAAFAVHFYPKFYFPIADALTPSKANEVYLRNINISDGSDICVKPYTSVKQDTMLLTNLVLVNEGDTPIFIERNFRFKLIDNSQERYIPELTFSLLSIDTSNEASVYEEIRPYSMRELRMKAEVNVDTAVLKYLQRDYPTKFAESHYTATYSFVHKGSVEHVNQNVNINCSGARVFYKHKH
jgi:hypothetical protein